MKHYFTLLFVVLFSIHLPAQVSISDFNPKSGPAGTIVTITGNNFSTIPANDIVYFGATKATVLTATNNQLTAEVPVSATFQPVSVTTNSHTAFSASGFISTFSGGGTIDANSFAPKVDYITGNYPRSVATGDWNEDSKPDIVALNNVGNSMSVFKNSSMAGNILFDPKSDFPTGGTPMHVITADVDMDGKLDMVVSNYQTASSSIAVFRNISTAAAINFDARIDFPVGPNPHTIAFVDMDADGKPDLIFTENNGNDFTILKNTSFPGTISFAPANHFVYLNYPLPLAVTDLDQDGKPDVLAINANDSTLNIFRNTTTGSLISFDLPVVYATANTASNINVGDLDGDGKPEIAIANTNANTVSVFRNDCTPGNVLFAARKDIVTGGGPYNVAIGDLDGDGKPDLATANFYESTISILKNFCAPGVISFMPKIDLVSGSRPRSVNICDYDGDGRPDIAACNSISNTLSLFKNQQNILPLKLLNFYAQAKNEDVLLNWQTEAEKNTARFIVQHASNGIDFSDIGNVIAQDNNRVNNYSFIDEHAIPGNNFYRLKMIDRDGAFFYSPVRNIFFDKSPAFFVRFANPSTGNVIIYHSESINATINITDTRGRVIKNIALPKGISSNSIRLNGLAGGIYLVVFKDGHHIISKPLMVY